MVDKSERLSNPIEEGIIINKKTMILKNSKKIEDVYAFESGVNSCIIINYRNWVVELMALSIKEFTRSADLKGQLRSLPAQK